MPMEGPQNPNPQEQSLKKEGELLKVRGMKVQLAEAGNRITPEEREQFSHKIEEAETALKQELTELYGILKATSPREYESVRSDISDAVMKSVAGEQKTEGRNWAAIDDARQKAWEKTKILILGVGTAAASFTTIGMLANTPTLGMDINEFHQLATQGAQWMIGTMAIGYTTLAALGIGRGLKAIGDKLHNNRLWKERTNARDQTLKERGMN
ncbi:MAG: hypothetical protein Q7R71_00905 [bacterium]|nr:hypothetical protein [bacterium]